MAFSIDKSTVTAVTVSEVSTMELAQDLVRSTVWTQGPCEYPVPEILAEINREVVRRVYVVVKGARLTQRLWYL